MTTTFETAQVGDRVWGLNYGWAIVSHIDLGSKYPIVVNFSGRIGSFTYDGKNTEIQLTQSLFWDEVTITPPEKPLPKLEVDTKVLVWDYPDEEPTRGHFSHFEKNGQIATFSLGRTSWSIENNPVMVWEHWELAKD